MYFDELYQLPVLNPKQKLTHKRRLNEEISWIVSYIKSLLLVSPDMKWRANLRVNSLSFHLCLNCFQRERE